MEKFWYYTHNTEILSVPGACGYRRTAAPCVRPGSKPFPKGLMCIGIKRRIGGLLLALVLAAGLCPTGRAAGAVLRIAAPEELPRTGESFTVAVELAENPGFAAVQFTLAYDRAVLACTGAAAGPLLEGSLWAANPNGEAGAIVAAVSLQELRGDGRLAEFTFTVKGEGKDPGFRLEEALLTRADGVEIPHSVIKTHPASPAGGETQESPVEGTSTGTPFPDPPPVKPEEIVFSDTAGHRAETEIAQAARLGILQGYAGGSFRPDAPVTRAQFAVILWRQAGRPAAEATPPFTDTGGLGGEFGQAIAWAYDKGYLQGVSPTAFRPGATLSRQAAMKILFQYAGGTAGMEQMFYGVYDGIFPDSGEMAEWARAPVYWGVFNTLIEAEDGDRLRPAEPATRGQLARAMVRYLEKFGGGLGE